MAVLSKLAKPFVYTEDVKVIPRDVVWVIIHKSVRTIPARIFAHCICLERLDIHRGLVTIGNNAFCGCKSLKLVRLPETVRVVGAGAFRECLALICVVLNEGLEKIGNSCFSYCLSMELFVSPLTLRSLGESVCQGCKSLEVAALNDGLDCVQFCAFGGCVNMRKIGIPNSMEQVGALAIPRSVTRQYKKSDELWSTIRDRVVKQAEDIQKETLMKSPPRDVSEESTATLSAIQTEKQSFEPAKFQDLYKQGFKHDLEIGLKNLHDGTEARHSAIQEQVGSLRQQNDQLRNKVLQQDDTIQKVLSAYHELQSEVQSLRDSIDSFAAHRMGELDSRIGALENTSATKRDLMPKVDCLGANLATLSRTMKDHVQRSDEKFENLETNLENQEHCLQVMERAVEFKLDKDRESIQKEPLVPHANDRTAGNKRPCDEIDDSSSGGLFGWTMSLLQRKKKVAANDQRIKKLEATDMDAGEHIRGDLMKVTLQQEAHIPTVDQLVENSRKEVDGHLPTAEDYNPQDQADEGHFDQDFEASAGNDLDSQVNNQDLQSKSADEDNETPLLQAPRQAPEAEVSLVPFGDHCDLSDDAHPCTSKGGVTRKPPNYKRTDGHSRCGMWWRDAPSLRWKGRTLTIPQFVSELFFASTFTTDATRLRQLVTSITNPQDVKDWIEGAQTEIRKKLKSKRDCSFMLLVKDVFFAEQITEARKLEGIKGPTKTVESAHGFTTLHINVAKPYIESIIKSMFDELTATGIQTVGSTKNRIANTFLRKFTLYEEMWKEDGYFPRTRAMVEPCLDQNLYKLAHVLSKDSASAMDEKLTNNADAAAAAAIPPSGAATS